MLIVCDAVGDHDFEELLNVAEGQVARLGAHDDKLDEAHEAVYVALVRHIVADELQVFFASHLFYLLLCHIDLACSALVSRCIADELGENVLVDELLYDALACL